MQIYYCNHDHRQESNILDGVIAIEWIETYMLLFFIRIVKRITNFWLTICFHVLLIFLLALLLQQQPLDKLTMGTNDTSGHKGSWNGE